jgi:hypothetical protein
MRQKAYLEVVALAAIRLFCDEEICCDAQEDTSVVDEHSWHNVPYQRVAGEWPEAVAIVAHVVVVVLVVLVGVAHLGRRSHHRSKADSSVWIRELPWGPDGPDDHSNVDDHLEHVLEHVVTNEDHDVPVWMGDWLQKGDHSGSVLVVVAHEHHSALVWSGALLREGDYSGSVPEWVVQLGVVVHDCRGGLELCEQNWNVDNHLANLAVVVHDRHDDLSPMWVSW